MRRLIDLRSYSLIWLIAIGPTFIVLGFLVIFSGLTLIAAGVSFVCIAGVSAWLVYFFCREVMLVANYLDQLVQYDRAVVTHPGRPIPRANGGRLAFTRTMMGTLSAIYRRHLNREQAAALQLDHARSTIHALPDPIITVDAQRIVRDMNPAAVAQFGERLLDRDLSDKLRHPAVLEAVEEIIAGAPGRSMAYRPAGPFDQTFEIRIQPFETIRSTSDSDNPKMDRGALLSLHDVTAGKRSEQMRADFVANASHELRTPLSTLVGFIETIRGPAREDAEARDKFLGIMAEQANRMSRLVSDLLSLSRIELDEHTPPVEAVELAGVVAAVARALEQRARRRSMSIDVVTPDGLPLITGDADQLAQVVQNLIDNAINYGRDGTAISVTLSKGSPNGRRQAGVTMQVADQGEGIAKEHVPRLTERFYRVDPARSRAIGGTGLGLAIVKHILARHRARLAIDSAVGKGTTVTIYFPRVAQQDGTDGARSAA